MTHGSICKDTLGVLDVEDQIDTDVRQEPVWHGRDVKTWDSRRMMQMPKPGLFVIRFAALVVGCFLLCAGHSLMAPTPMALTPSAQAALIFAFPSGGAPRILGSTASETLQSDSNTSSFADIPPVNETLHSNSNTSSSAEAPYRNETLQSDTNTSSFADMPQVNETLQSNRNTSSSTEVPYRNETLQSDTNTSSFADRPLVNETLHSDGNATPFRSIIDPQTLPPFWLMSIMLPLQVILQFMIFGFDVKTQKEAANPSEIIKGIKYCVKTACSLTFTLMALNSMRRDVIEFQQAHSADDSILRVLSQMLILLLTSPNVKAAVPFFASLLMQTPSAVLSNDKFTLYPKYPTLFRKRRFTRRRHRTSEDTPEDQAKQRRAQAQTAVLEAFFHLPATPWASRWMAWPKWCYTMVLLPYCLVIFFFYVPVVGALMPPRCLFCMSSFCLGKHGCLCCLWLVLVGVSLGFWAHARDQLSSEWHFMWPFGCFFGGMMCVELFGLSSIQISTCFFRWQHGLDVDCLEVDGGFTSLGGNDRAGRELLKLQLQNKEDLMADWEFEATAQDPDDVASGEERTDQQVLLPEEELNQLNPDPVDFEVIVAWKTSVIVVSLFALFGYVFYSVLITASVRALFNANSDEGILKAWSDTLSERTIRSYVLYLRSSFTEGTALLSRNVNLIWNLI